MRKTPTLLILFAALLCLGGQPSAQQSAAAQTGADETARLNQWFAARWQEQLGFSPVQKSYLGIKDDAYDEIDDLSERGEDEQLAWFRKNAAELKKGFNYDRLTPEAKTSYDIWTYQLERTERNLPYRRRGYVFTQMQGAQAALPQFLITMHKVDAPADMVAYIARIGGIARAIDQLLVRAQAAAKEGVRPPRFSYEGVIAQSRGLVTGMPFGGSGRRAGLGRREGQDRRLAEGGQDRCGRGGTASGRRAPGAARQIQAVLRRADRLVGAGHEEHRCRGARRRRSAAGRGALQGTPRRLHHDRHDG